ncbi:hypothetical protein EN739_18970 [Mesorhizobium sp. M2A.F.Ca.ET.017.03.2.1]|uniref:hypothetical protein n=1 Tax=unclassified Mesorhizobium TaxID=325217 RepID=UPI000FC9EF02|nr:MULTISPECIES: hypothetical protein [unclassified Mesorhizobium]RUW39169.1 hypothetical protein EOA37_21195 [Mesorhizobium sp. M2A.F.Ca.ET.015.02.1.1]RVC93985.1 hypothetical protein EN739_18970 [Mesorhizobium sp. M2A.F.Ca.ET.017.03.2.1]
MAEDRAVSEIVSAELVRLPEKRPGLFPGRPWVVYYERATRDDGKRVKAGMRSFELKREAAKWAFSVCPQITGDELPF